MNTPVLEVRSLNKSFGGLVVTDDVSLDLLSGEIHALIGPNGAGKSTLVNQIVGELTSDSGEVFLHNSAITKQPTHLRVRQGLVRTFQISSVIRSFTTFENVLLAALGQLSPQPHWWQSAQRNRKAREIALDALDKVNLSDRANLAATELSYGEHRHLELAMALALNPSVLLLDEPMAGVGPREGEELAQLLISLRDEAAILLIEHDMDVVFSISDRISVLVEGRLIATDEPQVIRLSNDVKTAYFGDEEVAV